MEEIKVRFERTGKQPDGTESTSEGVGVVKTKRLKYPEVNRLRDYVRRLYDKMLGEYAKDPVEQARIKEQVSFDAFFAEQLLLASVQDWPGKAEGVSAETFLFEEAFFQDVDAVSLKVVKENHIDVEEQKNYMPPADGQAAVTK